MTCLHAVTPFQVLWNSASWELQAWIHNRIGNSLTKLIQTNLSLWNFKKRKYRKGLSNLVHEKENKEEFKLNNNKNLYYLMYWTFVFIALMYLFQVKELAMGNSYHYNTQKKYFQRNYCFWKVMYIWTTQWRRNKVWLFMKS